MLMMSLALSAVLELAAYSSFMFLFNRATSSQGHSTGFVLRFFCMGKQLFYK